MKNLLSLFMAVLAVLFISCGGGGDKESAEDEVAMEAGKQAQIAAMKAAGATDEEIEEAKKAMSNIQKNLKEMEEEEDSGEILSDKNIELLGLTVTERKITHEEWEKAKVLKANWKELSNEELRGLTTEKIEQMMLDAGFSDMESAKTSLSNMVDARNDIVSITMDIGMNKSAQVLDGKEGFEEKMKELGGKINEKGYSAEDLMIMDKNSKVGVTAAEILFRLDNM